MHLRAKCCASEHPVAYERGERQRTPFLRVAFNYHPDARHSYVLLLPLRRTKPSVRQPCRSHPTAATSEAIAVVCSHSNSHPIRGDDASPRRAREPTVQHPLLRTSRLSHRRLSSCRRQCNASVARHRLKPPHYHNKICTETVSLDNKDR